MPATILSDNGVSSGSSGIKTTGANDGILALQTTTAGGTATTAVTVDTSQNVGIGTSSPAQRLEIAAASPRVRITDTDGGYAQIEADNGNLFLVSDNGNTVANSNLTFGVDGTERARIDSSGNLLVGTTSSSGLITGIQASTSTYSGYFTSNYTASGNASIMFWGRNGGGVAAAVRYKDATTSMEFYSPTGHTVAYTTSSDYRLKENIQPMGGALAKVTALRPVTYKWKEGFGKGSSQGFIAHELQSVVPEAVTGEKDAVDADGNPIYQGIDTSFLVATLTAAIQEQQALIQSLTAATQELKAELDATKAQVAALQAKE
jgi:Chaperone of endosialidase